MFFIPDDSTSDYIMVTDLTTNEMVQQNPEFECGKCSRIFPHQYALGKHMLKCDSLRNFSCPLCDYQSNRKWNVKSHIERVHAKMKKESKSIRLKRENKWQVWWLLWFRPVWIRREPVQFWSEQNCSPIESNRAITCSNFMLRYSITFEFHSVQLRENA